MRPTLVHLPPSPWSKRVITALRLCGIDLVRDVDVVPHTMIIGEAWLRWRLWAWSPSETVTVPVLLDPYGPGTPPIRDSTEIVRWGIARARRPFRLGDDALVARVLPLVDTVLAAGRHRASTRVAAWCDAKTLARDGVGAWIQATVMRALFSRMRTKYARPEWLDKDTDADAGGGDERALRDMTAAMDELLAIVRSKEGTFLGGSSTHVEFVDLLVASAVPFPPWRGHAGGDLDDLVPLFVEPGQEHVYRDVFEFRDRVWEACGSAATAAL